MTAPKPEWVKDLAHKTALKLEEWQDDYATSNVSRIIIESVLLTAIEREREENCKVVCEWCKSGVKAAACDNGAYYHPEITTHTLCAASPIRRRAEVKK